MQWDKAKKNENEARALPPHGVISTQILLSLSDFAQQKEGGRRRGRTL
jgi:hypothetical protein